LILQWIADGPGQEARHILIDIGALAAERRNGHGYGRLHGAQAICDFAQANRGPLSLRHRQMCGHREHFPG
jgi:hypothetical protein